MSKKSGHCTVHGLQVGSQFEYVWYLAADNRIRIRLRRERDSRLTDCFLLPWLMLLIHPLPGLSLSQTACSTGRERWHVLRTQCITPMVHKAVDRRPARRHVGGECTSIS